MVFSAPRIEQKGPVFRLHWAEAGVRVRISRIYQGSRGELYGEISVQYRSDLPWDGGYDWRHIVGSRYQITSDRSRVDIAKRCESEVSDVPWRQLIEEASINVLGLYRRGAKVLDLSEWTPLRKSPGGYMLTPLLAEGLPNMIFGDGGVGKSMVALWRRKTNVGPLLKPVTLKITFAPSFSVEKVSPGEYRTLAAKLPLAERMAAALGNGAMSSSALAEAIGANSNSVRTTLARKEDRFVRLPDGKWGLRAKR